MVGHLTLRPTVSDAIDEVFLDVFPLAIVNKIKRMLISSCARDYTVVLITGMCIIYRPTFMAWYIKGHRLQRWYYNPQHTPVSLYFIFPGLRRPVPPPSLHPLSRHTLQGVVRRHLPRQRAMRRLVSLAVTCVVE